MTIKSLKNKIKKIYDNTKKNNFEMFSNVSRGSSRRNDTEIVNLTDLLTNTNLKGQTLIENLNCENVNFNNDLKLNDNKNIYNGHENNFYNKTKRDIFRLTDEFGNFPFNTFDNVFASSMYMCSIYREDGDFDNLNSPYLAFYVVVSNTGKILPVIPIIQKQVESFQFVNDNEDLEVLFTCESYDFDILFSIVQIS